MLDISRRWKALVVAGAAAVLGTTLLAGPMPAQDNTQQPPPTTAKSTKGIAIRVHRPPISKR